MNTLNLSVRCPLACIAAFAAVSALAQAPAPATSGSDSDSSSEVVLSPFQVNTSKDKGYHATNANSGTRLDTPIRDLPMSLEVITEDFIRDIGATNAREALEYSAGVLTTTQQTEVLGSDNGQSLDDETRFRVKLRGMTTSDQLRYGFKLDQSSDSINISRIEVVRGPGALLYGTGSFGGIVNFIPKGPLQVARGEVEFGDGNQGYLRSAVDYNLPLGAEGSLLRKDRAAVRITAAAQRTGDWRDFNTAKSFFFSPSFAFDPTPTTHIIADYQHQRTQRKGIGPQRVTDFNATSTANPFGLPYLPTPNIRTFRWSGPDTYRDVSFVNYMMQVEQRVLEHLTVVAGVNYSDSQYSLRNMSLGLVPFDPTVPNFFTNDPLLGGLYELRYQWTDSNEDRPELQTRLEANYQFKVGSTSHSFLLGRTDGTLKNEDNAAVTGFNYRSEVDYNYIRFQNNQNSTFVPNSATKQVAWDQGEYLVYQGKYFHDRFQIVAGVRDDRADILSDTYDASTGARTKETRRPNNQPTTKITPQWSASYRVLEPLSIYATASGGLNPNYFQVDGSGQPFDPVEAKSREVGLKFDFLDGKLSGTIAAFHTARKNTLRSFAYAPNPVNNGKGAGHFDPTKPIIYDLVIPNQTVNGKTPLDTFTWATAFGQEFLLSPDVPADQKKLEDWFTSDFGGDVASGLYGTTRSSNNPSMDKGAQVAVDDVSEGSDVQLVFSPNDNYSMVLTYAYVDRFITNGGHFVSTPYKTTPWDIWAYRVGRANFTDITDPSTFNGSIQKGERLDDTPYNQASVWQKYSFTKGWLKGVDVSLGYRYTGPREFVGAVGANGQSSNQVDTNTSDESDFDLALGYVRKLAGHAYRFRVNGTNILDRKKLIGNTYMAPLQVRFTTNVEF